MDEQFKAGNSKIVILPKNIAVTALALFLITALGCEKDSSNENQRLGEIVVVEPTPPVNSQQEEPPAPPPARTMSSPLEKLHNKEKKDDELIEAIKTENLNQVKELLENGADPNSFYNSSDDYYHTALGLAVDKKNVEIARLLLERGADVNKNSFDTNYTFPKAITNFSWAVHNQDVQMMRLLADHNANLEEKEGNYPIILGVKKAEVLSFLIENKFNINIQNIEGRTVLIEAVFDQNVNLVKDILRYKPKLNLRTEALKVTDYQKLTAYQLAKIYGDKEIIQALKKAGAK